MKIATNRNKMDNFISLLYIVVFVANLINFMGSNKTIFDTAFLRFIIDHFHFTFVNYVLKILKIIKL